MFNKNVPDTQELTSDASVANFLNSIDIANKRISNGFMIWKDDHPVKITLPNFRSSRISDLYFEVEYDSDHTSIFFKTKNLHKEGLRDALEKMNILLENLISGAAI